MRPGTRLASLHTAVVVAALSLATSAAAQSSRLANIRIDNFGQVNSKYFRGAQPKGDDYADLAALGVKTVINLTSDDADRNEKAMTERNGMRYVQIPMTTHKPPTTGELEHFLRIVNDPANQPVFIHCVGGRHRTGVMTAAYRMTQEGWSADQAFAEMKKYKYGADFLHPEFKEFVYAYHQQPPRAAPAAAVAATKAGS